MDTSPVEQLIRRRCSETRLDNALPDLLAAVADAHGGSAHPAAIEQGIQFVRGYIEQVPYVLKVAWTAARTVGLEPEMTRVLDSVISYWESDDDIIPDRIGMIGLLDDAYGSLCVLQSISDHFQLQTGKYLFPDNLTAANKIMRKIIGEPYASDLDRLVIQTMQKSGIIASLMRFSSEEKQVNFVNQSTIWNHGAAGISDIASLAPLGLLPDPD